MQPLLTPEELKDLWQRASTAKPIGNDEIKALVRMARSAGHAPDAEDIEDRLFLAARIHAGYETDAAFVDAVGYSADLHVAKLREALQKSGLLPNAKSPPEA